MADIYDYIRALVLHSEPPPAIFSKWVRKEELIERLSLKVSEILNTHNVADIIDHNEHAVRLYNELMSAEIIFMMEEDFAGKYYVGGLKKFAAYKDADAKSSNVITKANAIGIRYYPDVFLGYRNKYLSAETGLPLIGTAPGSDRIVSFSDNQVAEFTGQTAQLIDVVEAQNQIDGIPGLRELMIGQLRAGQELIRSGSVRLHLLHLTLIETLRFLARRYENHVIGGLSAALITALVKQFGIDA